MNPFSPLYYVKQNKSRCILLMVMLLLSAVIYVGGLYVTSPPATFDNLCEINDHCIYMYDLSVTKNQESRMDEFLAEIEADPDLDYVFAGPTKAHFNWDTVMAGITCGTNQITFGSVEDFKKHCEYLDIEVDFSKIKTGSLILTEMLAKNTGLSLGDKVDSSLNDSELIEVTDEESSFTLDYIIDVTGYGAYMITDETSEIAVYVYGKNTTGEALRNKVISIGQKYGVYMGTITKEEIDSEFSSFYFIYGFIVILISVIIAITINTAFSGMYQKRNFEIAVYRGIGIPKKKIFRKLVSELLLIDGIALFCGTIITALFLYLFNNIVLYPDGLYLEYFHPLAISGVVICNLLSLLPLILFRIRQIKKADICEY